jgi:hypothetical protein
MKMMKDYPNPEVKAKELFYAMYCNTSMMSKKDAQKCLLIALEQLIQATDGDHSEYWCTVRKEVNRLWA